MGLFEPGNVLHAIYCDIYPEAFCWCTRQERINDQLLSYRMMMVGLNFDDASDREAWNLMHYGRHDSEFLGLLAHRYFPTSNFTVQYSLDGRVWVDEPGAVFVASGRHRYGGSACEQGTCRHMDEQWVYAGRGDQFKRMWFLNREHRAC